MKFPHKDLVGLRFLTGKEIEFILDQAKGMKEVLKRPVKQIPALRGRTVLNLFFEPSTRTRNSFEMAARRTGASTLAMNVAQSSVKKGESLFDTIKNFEALGIDAIVIRHSHGGAPNFVGRIAKVPVINAGDGYNEHPTQGLLDIFTMIEAQGTVKDKKIMILGDITHSRVAKSDIWGLTKLGAQVFVCGPQTLVPPGIEEMGAKIITNLDKEINEMDFINVLRIQLERQDMAFFPSVREYREIFGLTKERLKKAKKGVTILHPGPLNRGIEIDSDVADGPNNVILTQVTNGIAVRMAVLYLLLSGK